MGNPLRPLVQIQIPGTWNYARNKVAFHPFDPGRVLALGAYDPIRRTQTSRYSALMTVRLPMHRYRPATLPYLSGLASLVQGPAIPVGVLGPHNCRPPH